MINFVWDWVFGIGLFMQFITQTILSMNFPFPAVCKPTPTMLRLTYSFSWSVLIRPQIVENVYEKMKLMKLIRVSSKGVCKIGCGYRLEGGSLK